jgi:predicted nucleic acid-binding protein
MKVAYVDSSVLVGLMFGEDGAENLEKQLMKFDDLISSNLVEAEVLSAAVREGLPLEEAIQVIGTISLFFADSNLTGELQRVFEVDYIRGADAYHLACALSLDPRAEELYFCSLDKKQLDIAKSLGFRPVNKT